VKPALLLACGVAALALAGCDRCGKKKPAATAAEPSRPERDVPPPTRDQPTARELPPSTTPGTIRRNAPLDIEQATAMMPPLIGAPLGAPTTTDGAQVRFPYCLGAANLAEAGKRAEDALRDSGWQDIHGRPPDPAAPAARFAIAAARDDYRISITIEGLPRPDCNAAGHKFFATATMNKITTPTTEPEPPAPAP
jgi:hypothetical protein